MADRRSRQWFDADVAVQTMVSGTPQFDQLSVPGDELRTLTVARIIVDLNLTPSSLSAAQQGGMKCTIGVGLATTDAIGVGITALPDIFSNVSFPIRGWLFKGAMFSTWESPTGVVEHGVVETRHLDLGAMRKLDNGVLYIVAGVETFDGAGYTCDLIGHCRFMCLT